MLWRSFGAIEWFATTATQSLLFGDPVQHHSALTIPMHDRYRNIYTLLGDRAFYPTKSKRFLKAEAVILEETISAYEFCQQRLDSLAALVADLPCPR